ncbi:hypothetical protein QOT17_017923 [Balamuthia mandrillaris]
MNCWFSNKQSNPTVPAIKQQDSVGEEKEYDEFYSTAMRPLLAGVIRTISFTLKDNFATTLMLFAASLSKNEQKIMKLGNLRMNVDESVDAWNLRVRTALQEAFLMDFSETQVLKKFITDAVLDLKKKFLQQENIANMADALNLTRD